MEVRVRLDTRWYLLPNKFGFGFSPNPKKWVSGLNSGRIPATGSGMDSGNPYPTLPIAIPTTCASLHNTSQFLITASALPPPLPQTRNYQAHLTIIQTSSLSNLQIKSTPTPPHLYHSITIFQSIPNPQPHQSPIQPSPP